MDGMVAQRYPHEFQTLRQSHKIADYFGRWRIVDICSGCHLRSRKLFQRIMRRHHHCRLPLSHRFFETDQGWIDRPAHLILMGLSRDADDLGKSLADVFGCVEAAAPLRFQERHGQVHDFESDIDGHLDSSNDRIAVARSVKFRLSSPRYLAAGLLLAMASRYVNQESRARL